jgi:hypothetical protein
MAPQLAVLGTNYHIVAQRLGLFSDAPDRIHGVLDRIPIAVTANHGLEVVYSAILPRAAPVSFNLAERSLVDSVGGFFGGFTSTPPGQNAFDRKYVVHAADPAYVLSLLDEDARAAIDRLAGYQLQPLVTAQMLSIRHGQMSENPDRIEGDFRELVSAAHILGRSFVTFDGYR